MRKKTVVTSVDGPVSYPAGGFDIVIGGLSVIENCVVVPSESQLLAQDGYVYSVKFTVSGNKVTVVCKSMSLSSGAWSEMTGADLSGIKFNIVATGY